MWINCKIIITELVSEAIGYKRKNISNRWSSSREVFAFDCRRNAGPYRWIGIWNKSKCSKILNRSLIRHQNSVLRRCLSSFSFFVNYRRRNPINVCYAFWFPSRRTSRQKKPQNDAKQMTNGFIVIVDGFKCFCGEYFQLITVINCCRMVPN